MDWNLKCRVCLKEEGDLTSLLDKDVANISYGRKLMECSSIIINQDLNYPEKICSSCIADLTIAYNFRINCERSNAFLLSLFKIQNSENLLDCSDNINSSYKSNDFDLIPIYQQIKEEPILNDTIEDKIIDNDLCLLQAIKEEIPIDIEQSIKQEDENLEQDSDSVLPDLKDPLDVNMYCDSVISDECVKNDSKTNDNTLNNENNTIFIYNCRNNNCFAQFKSFHKYKSHLICHTTKRRFKCNKCEKKYKRKSHLSSHIRLKHTYFNEIISK